VRKLAPVFALLLAAATPPVYRGEILLPSDFTASGGKLEKGRYTMEVSHPGSDYVLTFLQGDQKKSSVTGHLRASEKDAPKVHLPLLGTHFLRSSEDPLPTGQERQFSKTGAAQYEEEKRDWKAVVRVYKAAEGNDAWFIFQERRQGGAWNTVDFQLSMAGK
jgi:hypothetical protein